jgi:hypothetical protein
LRPAIDDAGPEDRRCVGLTGKGVEVAGQGLAHGSAAAGHDRPDQLVFGQDQVQHLQGGHLQGPFLQKMVQGLRRLKTGHLEDALVHGKDGHPRRFGGGIADGHGIARPHLVLHLQGHVQPAAAAVDGDGGHGRAQGAGEYLPRSGIAHERDVHIGVAFQAIGQPDGFKGAFGF